MQTQLRTRMRMRMQSQLTRRRRQLRAQRPTIAERQSPWSLLSLAPTLPRASPLVQQRPRLQRKALPTLPWRRLARCPVPPRPRGQPSSSMRSRRRVKRGVKLSRRNLRLSALQRGPPRQIIRPRARARLAPERRERRTLTLLSLIRPRALRRAATRTRTRPCSSLLRSVGRAPQLQVQPSLAQPRPECRMKLRGRVVACVPAAF